jgi:hypothetical protein
LHVLAGRGGKEGRCWGWVRGLKMGQLTLSKGPARMGICNYVQGATILSDSVSSISHTTFVIYIQYEKKIFLPVQVKNKPCDRGTEHAFILGSMDCTVANSFGLC